MSGSVAKEAEAALDPERVERFCALVWREGKTRYRSLPWRHIDDAYAVLVSEVMLQQTQVKRVLRYWDLFLDRFPTIDALAAADTASVLETWQGLGYNRRALMLKRCAEVCSDEQSGALPHGYDELRALPGIGPATAAGVRAFAWNQPGVYLETNVRTVFLHEWFAEAGEPVRDKQLVPLVRATCPQDNPRDWYYALLDYGAYLKSVLPNPSRKSAHHTRQSTFEGSHRQKRAELVRIVLGEPDGIVFADLQAALNVEELKAGRPAVSEDLTTSIVQDLLSEGFFQEHDGRYHC